MVNIVPVFRVIGALLIAFAAFMLVPLLVETSLLRQPGAAFVLSALATAFAGLTLMALSPMRGNFELTRRQGFLVTALAWTVLPVFGAMPLMSGTGLSLTNAYFEAVSALSATGATVMTNLDEAAPSILLWRSLMQALGGVGVIVLSIVMMPFLKVGGMQLFHTENSDTSDKIVAKAFDMSVWILGIFLALLVLCAACYKLLGMSWFDAVNHAMTTVATGGMSTHDRSFGFFSGSVNFEAILWTGVFFMFAGAVPFVAFIRLAKGNWRSFFNDIQLRAFMVFLAAAILLIATTRTLRGDVPIDQSLTHAAFNVVSIVTTSGFSSEDFQLWGPFAVGAFFILMFVGGCSGSTSGGIKIYRFQILARLAGAHLSRIISPNRVHVVLYHDRRVEDDVAFAILAFFGVMLFSLIVSTFLLAWFGVDLVTALTGSAAAITNVGPGLGEIIGPAGNFQSLPDAAKWVLAAMMIMGRLEFFTIFVLLTPAFWRA
ncbi:MAG: TrkH family potassium uptake protein [Parvularculaceae bacterium]|nr:TrkH family potassium uptake protein [Parvularculaceae bacterium]